MKILVTGGAGFIGSNLCAALLQHPEVELVRVFDNLSTGFEHNISEFYGNPKFEFLKGDIRNFDECLIACKNIDVISHQAALGSVPRSVKDPLTTHAVNATGTLNVFTAAKESNIKRIVFAASSSTYGDNPTLPKVENKIGSPLSPYAVTKFMNEVYAKVYGNLYGIEYIGLRYFNVFGPNQDPGGAYAAVIPLFFKAALENSSPLINGDGKNSRDFTYVDNAVQANLLSIFTKDKSALNEIYNVACGEKTTLNELWEKIKQISDSTSDALHGENRAGDIPHSLADISKIKKSLNYHPEITVFDGLKKSYQWYKTHLSI